MSSGAQMPFRDHLPAPPLEELSKIQLMRTTLVKFIDQKNFEEIVQGCFVRVLLEMKRDGGAPIAGGPDQYYIAQVKGAKEGPPYSGFSWEKTTTKWHIVIELPPCFRATPNGNVVQLNSVSNTQFKPSEYQAWVDMVRQAGTGFIQLPQIQLRLTLLEEHKATVMSPYRGNGRRRPADDTSEAGREREARLAAAKALQLDEIKATHVFLPSESQLKVMQVNDLLEVERECLDMLSNVRLAINERSKCRICSAHICTVVCYPCKHQVMCLNCSASTTVCPAPTCGRLIEDKFEVYSS